MAKRPGALVSFDIDGTLTEGHGWAFLADRFDRRADYDRTTEGFRRGAVDEDHHLANLLALAEGHTIWEVEEVLASTPKVGHIRETVGALQERGVRTALLTHNPPYVCAWYARTFGFEAFEGCDVPPPVAGRIPAPGPMHADKVGSLLRLLAATRCAAVDAVHVGDSHSDLQVFRRVGAGIAFNARLPEVRSGADATVDSEDLSDILPVLERLSPRISGGRRRH